MGLQARYVASIEGEELTAHHRCTTLITVDNGDARGVVSDGYADGLGEGGLAVATGDIDMIDSRGIGHDGADIEQ